MEKFLMRIVKYVAFAANLCVFCAAAVGLGFGVFALVDGDAVAKLFAQVAEGFEVRIGCEDLYGGNVTPSVTTG